MDLKAYRAEIDRIDQELLSLFVKRMDVAKKIALLKKEQKLPIYQPERERELLDEKSKLAGEMLEPYVRKFFSELMCLSRELQQAEINCR